MFKKIRLFLIPMALTLGLGLYAQDDCPDDVEFVAPGEGEPGCIDYTDCNENGAFDYGEPCYDEPPEGTEAPEDEHEMTPVMHILSDIEMSFQHADEGLFNDIMMLAEELEAAAHAEHNEECDGCAGEVLEGAMEMLENMDPGDADHLSNLLWMLECETHFEHDPDFDCGPPPFEGEVDPVADAYFMALDDGDSPEDAFAAAADVVYELQVVQEGMSEEEYQAGLDHVSGAFHEALEDGASPDEAFGAAMAAAEELDGGEGEEYEEPENIHPIDQVFNLYGEHTWRNCESISVGAQSYWIGDEEFAAYPDPLCEEVFVDFYHAIDSNDDGVIEFGEAAVVWGDDEVSAEIFAENDLNDDGVVDEDEFMDATAPPEDVFHEDMDHDEADMGSPIDEAYFEALDNGASPQDALAAAEAVAYQLEVEEGDMPEEQFNADAVAIAEAFDQLIGDDVDPHEAYWMALDAVFGGEGEHDEEPDHDDDMEEHDEEHDEEDDE